MTTTIQCPYCGVKYTIEGDEKMIGEFAKYIENGCVNPLCSKGVESIKMDFVTAMTKGFAESTQRLAEVSRGLGREMKRLAKWYRGKLPKYTYRIQHPRKPNKTRKKQRLTRLQRRRKRQK